MKAKATKKESTEEQLAPEELSMPYGNCCQHRAVPPVFLGWRGAHLRRRGLRGRRADGLHEKLMLCCRTLSPSGSFKSKS